MSGSPTIIKEIDHPMVYLALKSDGIGYVFLKDDTVIDVEFQEVLIDLYNQLTNKKQTPFLFEGGNDVTVTKEARDNALLIEDRSPLKATAIVVDNLAYKLISNFYLKFNKPKRPYKVFSNKQEAVEWLRNHV